MKHPLQPVNYSGSLTELAEEIGDLRYDALAEFLGLLAQKIAKDSRADAGRGRVKLAKELADTADLLDRSKPHIEEAWRISAPFMKL